MTHHHLLDLQRSSKCETTLKCDHLRWYINVCFFITDSTTKYSGKLHLCWPTLQINYLLAHNWILRACSFVPMLLSLCSLIGFYAAPSPYTGEGVKPHIKPCDVTMLNLLPLSLSTFCTDPQWSCLDIVVLVLMQCTAKIIAASGIATFA